MKQYNILGGIDNLTEKTKMITREEYLKAVQLIQDYRVQINSEIDGLNLIQPRRFNIRPFKYVCS